MCVFSVSASVLVFELLDWVKFLVLGYWYDWISILCIVYGMFCIFYNIDVLYHFVQYVGQVRWPVSTKRNVFNKPKVQQQIRKHWFFFICFWICCWGFSFAAVFSDLLLRF